MHRNNRSGLLVLFALFTASAVSRGELLVYEPFDYTAGSLLNGLSGSAEFGFDAGSSWTYGGAETADVLAGTMTFATLPVAGNKGRYASTNTGQENTAISRPLDVSLASGTLWMSYLYQANAGAVQSGRGLAVLDSGGGRDFAAYGKRNGTAAPGAGHVDYNGNVQNTTGELGTDNPFLIIARFTNVGAGSGTGTGRMWQVSEAEYAAFDDDGALTEAELDTIDTNRIAEVTAAAPLPAVAADGSLGIMTVDLSGSTRHAWWFDELRIGTTLEDVACLPEINPAPVVDTAGGPQVLGPGAAVLHGTVLSTGTTETAAFFHWGTSDGGTDPGAWDETVPMGPVTGALPAAVQVTVSNLAAATRYYYTVSATNAAGRGWAPAREDFLTPAPPAVTPYPHVVIIMADDLGYGDPGCYNPNSKIPTPNMDRLAAQGTRFTDVHTPSAVCTPTRYALLTGRYAWRSRLKNGVLNGYDPPLLEPGRPTVAALLRDRGYATACIGKWHLGMSFKDGAGDPITEKNLGNVTGETLGIDWTRTITGGPADAGFDYSYGINASLDMPPYAYIENGLVQGTPSVLKNFGRSGLAEPSFEAIDVLPALTDKAVQFITQCAATNPAQPFFLYFPLTAPHTPVVPTDEARALSGANAGDYGHFVWQADRTIGTVADALDELGIATNTLLIVTSDNGSTLFTAGSAGHEPNAPWRGRKSDIWEGGHRVPFIAYWPGRVPAGAVNGETFCLVDFMATLASLTGASVPENAGEDSYNVLPALLGEPHAQPIRPSTVHHSMDGMFALREGGWKFIAGTGGGGFEDGTEDNYDTGQLYDLVTDPAEATNLFAILPATVVDLRQKLYEARAKWRTTPDGDRDGDGLADGVETGTGIYVSEWNTGTDPDLPDTDSDGWRDRAEMLAGSDPNTGASVPTNTAVTVLYVNRAQLAGSTGTRTDAAVLGDWQPADTNLATAGPYFVRERTHDGSSQEYRTQCFLHFDLGSLSTNPVAEAHLALHQFDRLNSFSNGVNIAAVAVARVDEPWNSPASSDAPLCDYSRVSEEYFAGRNDAFGAAQDARGYHGGDPARPDDADGKVDATRLVRQWHEGAAANHGLRLALADLSFTAAAFSSADDPSDPGDETLRLVVTQVPHPDSDGDGLPDAWEWQKLGTLAYGADDDPDTDRHTNADEYAAGTNPNDPASGLRAEAAAEEDGNGFRLRWSSVPGQSYRIERASRLLPDDWQLLAVTNAAPAPEAATEYLDPAPLSTQRFYRVLTP